MTDLDFLIRLGKIYSMSTLFKYVIVRLAVLAIVICSVLLVFMDDSQAEDYMTGMVGVFNSGKQSLSESKFLNIGHREVYDLGLSYQYELGGWIDRAGNGRSGSGYGAFQLGVEAGDTTVARAMVGPSLITSPDSYLGGVAQMTEDFFLGIKGRNGNSVGMKYKHFSSAGLEQPNVGRDFMGVEVALPF